jgi:fructokinase
LELTMPKVVCFGEALIDFVPTVSGVTLVEAPAFKKAPGGAPANVAAALAKLGVSAGFIGQVGDDAFGHFIAQTLIDAGVDVSTLRFSTEARTALAFVSLRTDGEREFMFYRHPSADMLLRPGDVDISAIQAAQIFHYGSISLIGEPSRSATLRACQAAREAGLLVSYDPNLRINLWDGPDAARVGIRTGWPMADLIKVSEEELAFLTGSTPSDISLLSDLGDLCHPDLSILIITLGKDGCRFVTTRFSGDVPGFSVDAVDTTGAGDGFLGGFLAGLLEHPDARRDEGQLREICRFGNAVGALTTTERGAIPALPTRRRVAEFLSSRG